MQFVRLQINNKCKQSKHIVLVFVELKSVVTDSEVLILSNKIKKLMEVKTDTIRK